MVQLSHLYMATGKAIALARWTFVGKVTSLLFNTLSRFDIALLPMSFLDFPDGSDSKASAYNVGDPGSIPGSRRSPREEKGYPLQYSYLENPLDRGAWWVHGIAKMIVSTGNLQCLT